jgi:hypothetical protein
MQLFHEHPLHDCFASLRVLRVDLLHASLRIRFVDIRSIAVLGFVRSMLVRLRLGTRVGWACSREREGASLETARSPRRHGS